MLSRLSLKYRIALVIFVLEGVMMSIVLWQVVGLSLNSAAKQQELTHDMLLELVSDLSRTALLTTEYADLQLYLEQVQKEPTVERVMVANANNRVVSSTPASAVGKALPKMESIEHRYWRTVSVSTPAGALGTLAVEFTSEQLEATNTRVRNLGIGIAVTGMLVIAVVGLVTGFALTRRLEHIARVTQQFADGELNIHARVSGRDELAALGNTIDTMIHQVTESQQRLQEQGEHIRLLLASTAEAIYGVDLAGICTFVNPACVRLLGYQFESELVGEPIHKLTRRSDPECRPDFHKQSRIEHCICKFEGTHGDDEMLWRKDGTCFPVEFWAHPILRDEKVIGTVVTFLDITDRKQVEEELAKHRRHLEELVDERTKELTRLNKELEAFSYSVSHDLRAPLRAIDGFSQAVIEDYGSQLDEIAHNYLQRTRAGAQRMAELIDDILKLSKVSRSELHTKTVNLTAIAQHAIQRLQQQDEKRHVKTIIKPGLTGQADAKLLRIALENLLDNAWKYTGKTPNPRIEFGSTRKADETVYFVRDNGVGFDAQYIDKLFGAFQRLHSEQEFPGTGIGLATVQRVIHRHGGRIWAESELGKGAVFSFTLGKATTRRNSSDASQG